MPLKKEDTIKRRVWEEFINTLHLRIATEKLENDVFFHGTSDFVAQKVAEEGLMPEELTIALLEADRHHGNYGTFWGNLQTASAYAIDTAFERHHGSSPILFASLIKDRLQDTVIVPDGATLDFPLDGLTKLSDSAVLKKWIDTQSALPWQESLHDLGAVICIHDFTLPIDELYLIRSIEDVEPFIDAVKASKLEAINPNMVNGL